MTKNINAIMIYQKIIALKQKENAVIIMIELKEKQKKDAKKQYHQIKIKNVFLKTIYAKKIIENAKRWELKSNVKH